jgi:hypothetical protein
LQSSAALQPPESVQALLDARLAALPADARDLLLVAAVGGADLSVDRAARLLGCPPLALREAWSILEANNVLRGEAFSHDMVHEAALRAAPLGLRRRIGKRACAGAKPATRGSVRPVRRGKPACWPSRPNCSNAPRAATPRPVTATRASTRCTHGWTACCCAMAAQTCWPRCPRSKRWPPPRCSA